MHEGLPSFDLLLLCLLCHRSVDGVSSQIPFPPQSLGPTVLHRTVPWSFLLPTLATYLAHRPTYNSYGCSLLLLSNLIHSFHFILTLFFLSISDLCLKLRSTFIYLFPLHFMTGFWREPRVGLCLSLSILGIHESLTILLFSYFKHPSCHYHCSTVGCCQVMSITLSSVPIILIPSFLS